MISIVILALVATSLTLANEQPRQQVAANQPSADRQGRSVSGNSNSGNSLHQNGNSNFIDHNSSKARIELERRQVQEFMTLKNLAKSIVKLVFGNQDEISATSRHVLGILGKVSVDTIVYLKIWTFCLTANSELTRHQILGAWHIEKHIWPEVEERNRQNHQRHCWGCC